MPHVLSEPKVLERVRQCAALFDPSMTFLTNHRRERGVPLVVFEHKRPIVALTKGHSFGKHIRKPVRQAHGRTSDGEKHRARFLTSFEHKCLTHFHSSDERERPLSRAPTHIPSTRELL